MAFHKLNIRQEFYRDTHPQYDTDSCYLTYHSKADSQVIQLSQEKSERDALTEKTVAKIFQDNQKGQVNLMVRQENMIVLLTSKLGAICVSLGLPDYSRDVEFNKVLGELIHQYYDQEKKETYISLMHSGMVEQAKGSAEMMYEAYYGTPPKHVYLRVSSAPGKASELTNVKPEGWKIDKYINLDHVKGRFPPEQVKSCEVLYST